METQKEKAMVALHVYERLCLQKSSVKYDIIRFINNPEGKPVVTLSTGETAIDMDDAWLIIGRKDGIFTEEGSLFLRDKRRQRDYDENPEKKHLEIVPDSDKLIHWDIERLFETAEIIVKQIDRKILS